jgi:hypothetical protein
VREGDCNGLLQPERRGFRNLIVARHELLSMKGRQDAIVRELAAEAHQLMLG